MKRLWKLALAVNKAMVAAGLDPEVEAGRKPPTLDFHDSIGLWQQPPSTGGSMTNIDADHVSEANAHLITHAADIARRITDDQARAARQALEAADDRWDLPLHRTEAGYPNCSTCDGGGCPDCTDPA